MEEIIKMIDEAFAQGHYEDDDMKRASIYGKCLSKIQKFIKDATNKEQS